MPLTKSSGTTRPSRSGASSRPRTRSAAPCRPPPARKTWLRPDARSRSKKPGTPPMSQNLFDRLAAGIRDPHKTVIETAGERYSYADLVALSGRLAGALAGLGVRPGDRVAVQVEKSVPALVLYLAVVR